LLPAKVRKVCFSLAELCQMLILMYLAEAGREVHETFGGGVQAITILETSGLH
jgi:TRAP-type C4-dicarboxylate transport system permease small subunit